MGKSSAVLLVMVVLVTAVFAGVGRAGECRQMLEQKCGTCHFVGHVCPMIKKKKGRWGWKRMVGSMLDQGAELTRDEVKVLVGCLSKPDESVLGICRDGSGGK